MTNPTTPAADAVGRDAERYRVLRCYALSGSWPGNGKAPGGLIAFSAGFDDPNVVTLGKLDQILDNMLGYLPHHDERTRADYQQWIRAETIARVKAVSDVQIDANQATARESALVAERDALRAALQKVVDWGPFPRVPDRHSSDPDATVSYSFAYGSNGERDYIRNIAYAALSATAVEGV